MLLCYQLVLLRLAMPTFYWERSERAGVLAHLLHQSPVTACSWGVSLPLYLWPPLQVGGESQRQTDRETGIGGGGPACTEVVRPKETARHGKRLPRVYVIDV